MVYLACIKVNLKGSSLCLNNIIRFLFSNHFFHFSSKILMETQKYNMTTLETKLMDNLLLESITNPMDKTDNHNGWQSQYFLIVCFLLSLSC